MGRADWVPRRLSFETDLSATGKPAERGQEIKVKTLNLIYLAIIGLAKQVWLLPKTIEDVIKQRRQQVVLNDLEAERLDRIRNPSKYLLK